jgi:WD40 repeat protein
MAWNIKLWDVATGKQRATLQWHTTEFCVAFSPDGKTLAAGGAALSLPHIGIKLWDVATGKEMASLQVPEGVVRSVAYSPDGRTLAAGSSDGTIQLWDVSSGK